MLLFWFWIHNRISLLLKQNKEMQLQTTRDNQSIVRLEEISKIVLAITSLSLPIIHIIIIIIIVAVFYSYTFSFFIITILIITIPTIDIITAIPFWCLESLSLCVLKTRTSTFPLIWIFKITNQILLLLLRLHTDTVLVALIESLSICTTRISIIAIHFIFVRLTIQKVQSLIWQLYIIIEIFLAKKRPSPSIKRYTELLAAFI